MPRFMLDTDTCSYIMKRSHPQVLKRLQYVPVGDVCMSVVTKPWADQWAFLGSVRKIVRSDVERIVQGAERQGRVLGVRLPR